MPEDNNGNNTATTTYQTTGGVAYQGEVKLINGVPHSQDGYKLTPVNGK